MGEVLAGIVVLTFTPPSGEAETFVFTAGAAANQVAAMLLIDHIDERHPLTPGEPLVERFLWTRRVGGAVVSVNQVFQQYLFDVKTALQCDSNSPDRTWRPLDSGGGAPAGAPCRTRTILRPASGGIRKRGRRSAEEDKCNRRRHGWNPPRTGTMTSTYGDLGARSNRTLAKC